ANIGNHSIYWAANKRFSQIYSFEPISYTYEILLKNIELNFLKDIIKAYNIGIGKEKSQAVLKHEHVNNIGANQVEIMQGGGIMINSLDDFMQEVSNLTRVDFVKIDVEGFEDNVFLGAKRFFEKFKPLIMVEIFDEHRKNIFEILKSYNYNLLTNIS
ncbi:FkbM family methyltransferase, partial [Klebsiella pneumoniae]|uniref:FkbM family methyltransferase n=1 Tax=Klebsiella pneumoniae TaxID=573 RepID=UPI000E5B1765